MRRVFDNPRAKEQTNSFYFEQELLDMLDFIAQIEGQSRSIVIERALFFIRTQGGENAWSKSAKKHKKKKKIHPKQKRNKANRQGRKEPRCQQKCLFDSGD